MSDIIEDLISARVRGLGPPPNWAQRAEDEIARLRAELAEARQIRDIIVPEGFRVAGELESRHNQFGDIEHRFKIGDGESTFGVSIVIAKLRAARGGPAVSDAASQPGEAPASPADAELEKRTGEPHIDGWPLMSGLPRPREAREAPEQVASIKSKWWTRREVEALVSAARQEGREEAAKVCDSADEDAAAWCAAAIRALPRQ